MEVISPSQRCPTAFARATARGHDPRDRARRHRHRARVCRPGHAGAPLGDAHAGGSTPARSSPASPLWGIALVAPAGFVLFGTNRLVRILATVRGRIPRKSTVLRALDGVADDVIVASGLAVPDGRPVSELVIGPFGAAVIRDLPPAAVTRVREGRWEVRTRRGWVSIENPLDRAARDAERVRRWLGHDDADFIVKVYAAVVGPAPTVAGRPTAPC